MSAIGDKRKRLVLAREHAGYRSARQAALTMGWPYPTYASHENGIRDIPHKVAQKYARAFRVSPEFILFGTNAPDWATEFRNDFMLEVRTPIRGVRLFTDADGNALREWIARQVPGIEFSISDPKGVLSPHVAAVEVTNDAMRSKPPVAGDREIFPGDIVMVDMDKQPRAGDVAAILVDGDPTIHLRKMVMRGGVPAYVALNADYGEVAGSVVGTVTMMVAKL